MSNSTPAPPDTGRRRALLWVVKIVVSSGLLYILFRQLDAGHLWRLIRDASFGWIAAALLLYYGMLLISTWRWQLLLRAQDVSVAFGTLLNSYLVATFANNFLPSNIGGDVVRIRDTARVMRSKTQATAIVLADRGVGVIGLAFVAACGSTLTARRSEALGPLGPALLWGGVAAVVIACIFVLAMPNRFVALARPLRAFHAEWVDHRSALVAGMLQRFRRAPTALALGFVGAIAVQATLVAFYFAVAKALHLDIPIGHLAILVPVSFIVQMVPMSLNGLGVREYTFVLYLREIGVKTESAVALSFIGAALVMLFSMSGAAAYVARSRSAGVSGDSSTSRMT